MLVANLPYNVATGLVLDLLACAPMVVRMLVMVQREVGERLAATPGSRVYGIPSVKRAWWADARIVAAVPATVFVPRPKVDSVLLEIVRHAPPAADPAATFALVTAGFAQRRKMLRSSLAGSRRRRGVRGGRGGADGPGRGARRRGLVAARRRRRAMSPERRRPRRTSSATVTAPAKLTLHLRVTGVRADGYHLIDAEMVALDLADELTFGPGDGVDMVDETGRGGLGAAYGDNLDDNLVVRALRVVDRRARVVVRKRIPLGAGLGGGSADAAAVLRWAGCLDPQLALRLGADVPFCLLGGGRARVRGIGEVLEPLPPQPATFTLLTPPFGCSTPAVYRAWDELGGPRHPTQRPRAGRAGGRAAPRGLARPAGRSDRTATDAGRQRLDVVRGGGAPGPGPARRQRGRGRALTARRLAASGSLLALGPALEAGALQHLLVLLLAHALAALLDQRTHEDGHPTGPPGMLRNGHGRVRRGEEQRARLDVAPSHNRKQTVKSDGSFGVGPCEREPEAPHHRLRVASGPERTHDHQHPHAHGSRLRAASRCTGSADPALR